MSEAYPLDPRDRAASNRRITGKHIVILTHADDAYLGRGYLLEILSGHWTRAGHRVSVVAGTKRWPAADVAIVHVDLSVLPEAYARASKRYRVVLNGRATDIRKRVVSRQLLGPRDDWTGPVIVKTDLNCRGIPERRLQRIEQRRRRSGVTPLPIIAPYEVLPSLRVVPKGIWTNPDLVVERFLPEKCEEGYAVRVWSFLGNRERCTRYISRERIVKAGNTLRREAVPVPRELRAERERLGFDYGKFDFVVRGGKAILFDANRTPSTPPWVNSPALRAANARLAKGIEAFLK